MESKKFYFGNVLDSEHFGDHRGDYFLDLKKAKNQSLFLAITRSQPVPDSTYRRSQVILFEEDIACFVEAMSMLLGRLASGKLGESC